MKLPDLDHKVLEYIAEYNHAGLPELAFSLKCTEEEVHAIMLRLKRRQVADRAMVGDITRLRDSKFWKVTQKGRAYLASARDNVRPMIMGRLSDEWMATSEVFEDSGFTGGSVRTQLVRMFREGLIQRRGNPGTGYQYALLEVKDEG